MNQTQSGPIRTGLITDAMVKPVGKLLKPHGICGEMTVLLTMDVDLASFSCVFLKLDGIYVPFFLTAVRMKSSETDLITIDGVTDEQQAAALCPAELYVMADELGEDAADGLYASDLTGFSVDNDGVMLGKIVAIDDTTANCLFIIETPDGEKCLVPVADEFIGGIDAANKVLFLSLPTGLVDLNTK